MVDDFVRGFSGTKVALAHLLLDDIPVEDARGGATAQTLGKRQSEFGPHLIHSIVCLGTYSLRS